MDYYEDKQKSHEEMADCVTWLVTAPFKFLARHPWLMGVGCLAVVMYVVVKCAAWAVSLALPLLQ